MFFFFYVSSGFYMSSGYPASGDAKKTFGFFIGRHRKMTEILKKRRYLYDTPGMGPGEAVLKGELLRYAPRSNPHNRKVAAV